MTDTDYKRIFKERHGLSKMKFIKRISLFVVVGGLFFLSGSYAMLKLEQFFYPKRYEQQQKMIETKTEKEQIIEAAVDDAPVITADTVYLIEKVNLSDGTVEEKEEAIPVKYIGLDRDSLIKELKEYDKNPALTDLEQGFETIELSGFSKDRVVICKYYRPEKKDEGFYLMVADHFVIVYKEDKKTIYMNTDILLENLSPALQEEIMKGKYMKNEQELYNFLESYSS